MKCKTWSTKINNFVVRRLKYIKINNQQHLSTTTAAIAATTVVTTTVSTAQLQQITQAKAAQPQAQLQQQQYLATCSTMPAMSKDNTATAVSLNESNFSELKIKELSAAAVAVATQQQQNPLTVLTTPAATAVTTTMATTSRLPQHNHNQMQHHRQQNRSTCGCGETSYTETENGISGSTRNLTNGHTSPIAAAMAQNSPTATMQQRNNSSRNCCRSTRPLNDNNTPQQQQNRTPCNAPSAAPNRRTPNDFIFGMSIGEGSFSNVYLGKDIQTKREYAIKVCEKRHIIREHKEEYIRREREVMHMLAGVPGFVNLSCTFQDERKLYFVMTYANNGDMLPWINKVGSFDVDCTRQYAAELVLACEQMHRRNIIHRDLKPDNILFDENMHTLIADFGSSKIMTCSERIDAQEALAADIAGESNSTATPLNSSEHKSRLSASSSTARSSDDDDNEEEDNETGSDEVDSPSIRRHPQRYQRRRRGSFVGTAQYVSPEVLQNNIITPSADLWALGCIIYQMISGLPPFRGSTEYVIFKEILACNLEFPEGFDPHAEDLVRKLLKIVPGQRLGAQDVNSCYTSIRSHPFFDGIDFDNVRTQDPPPINPNLPGVLNEPGFNAASRVFDDLDGLEPGLDAKQMSRILGWELGFGVSGAKSVTNAAGADVVDSAPVNNLTKKSNKTAEKNPFDLSAKEKQLRLQQQASDKWHVFADNEVILKKGYINKRKGLFARKRMFLLTTGPRLIYIDPVQMIKKGEIPWSPELRVETKNFRFFLVITPNRVYYLDDPTSGSPAWKKAIEDLHSLTYPEYQQNDSVSRIPATPSTTSTATTSSAPTSTITTPSLPSQFATLSMAASGTITTPSFLAAAATSSPSPPHSKSHKPASN